MHVSRLSHGISWCIRVTRDGPDPPLRAVFGLAADDVTTLEVEVAGGIRAAALGENGWLYHDNVGDPDDVNSFVATTQRGRVRRVPRG